MRYPLAVLTFLGLLAASSAQARCERDAGRFLEVRGDVFVVDDAGNQVEADAEMPICIGQEVRTGEKGRARVELVDLSTTGDGGPTRFDVGFDTRFTVNDLTIKEGDIPSRVMRVDLGAGIVRVWSVNWTVASELIVESGDFMCSIRGSDEDILVRRDREAAAVDVLIDSGLVICPDVEPIVFDDGHALRWDGRQFQPIEVMDREAWTAAMLETDLPGATPIARLSSGLIWRVKYFGKVRLTGAPSGKVATYKVPSHTAQILGTFDGTRLEGYWYAPMLAGRRCKEVREGVSFWGRVDMTLDPTTNKIKGKWGTCDREMNQSIKGFVSGSD